MKDKVVHFAVYVYVQRNNDAESFILWEDS